MDLHDFLARSLDILTLLETIDLRQAKIAADIAAFNALPAGDPRRSISIAKLRDEHEKIDAELDSVIHLISQ